LSEEEGLLGRLWTGDWDGDLVGYFAVEFGGGSDVEGRDGGFFFIKNSSTFG
jgi:hypothetical protein